MPRYFDTSGPPKKPSYSEHPKDVHRPRNKPSSEYQQHQLNLLLQNDSERRVTEYHHLFTGWPIGLESNLVAPPVPVSPASPEPQIAVSEPVFSSVPTHMKLPEPLFSVPLPKKIYLALLPEPASESVFSALETTFSTQEYKVPTPEDIFLNTMLNGQNEPQVVQSMQ
ncbi:hypothetical protein NPIL_385441 [Nephila pilipes]|uniref:Uncharacterized protein n=1 Tax=Nephila pilipes TaxID=299642 RepID=A0A8X6QP98_NEPPI|nr:hypothetical protein NPIL_385441 [Nephila pilipes]